MFTETLSWTRQPENFRIEPDLCREDGFVK